MLVAALRLDLPTVYAPPASPPLCASLVALGLAPGPVTLLPRLSHSPKVMDHALAGWSIFLGRQRASGRRRGGRRTRNSRPPRGDRT